MSCHPSNTGHFRHTHRKESFANAISAPTAMLVFFPQAKESRTLSVRGITWSRHLGEKWLFYRPHMLQSCDGRPGDDGAPRLRQPFLQKGPLSFCHTDSGVNPSGTTPSFSQMVHTPPHCPFVSSGEGLWFYFSTSSLPLHCMMNTFYLIPQFFSTGSEKLLHLLQP